MFAINIFYLLNVTFVKTTKSKKRNKNKRKTMSSEKISITSQSIRVSFFFLTNVFLLKGGGVGGGKGEGAVEEEKKVEGIKLSVVVQKVNQKVVKKNKALFL